MEESYHTRTEDSSHQQQGDALCVFHLGFLL